MTVSIKGFLETSFIDWPGKLAAVVFLPGCNFRCPFCHNHELVDCGGGLPDIPAERVIARIGELDGWVEGVVVSGGEPTLQAGLPGLLRQFGKAGLQIKLDTNGSRPDVLKGLIGEGLVQAVDMDLKAPLRKACYERLAGVPVDVSAISASIDLLMKSGVPHRFRTTYVPGLLDDGEIREMAGTVAPFSEYVLQAFNPRRVLDPAFGSIPEPEEAEMTRLRRVAASAAN
ncbi:anaerobic ribonucleoside-triphosphate reductase activating protein [Candidatus Moduliflexota bacterium]